MKMHIKAASPQPLLLRFEPSGAEHVLEPWDHIVIDWPDGPGGLLPAIEWEPDALIVGEPGHAPVRIWTSAGEELFLLGYRP
jgi:hypothetical protein